MNKLKNDDSNSAKRDTRVLKENLQISNATMAAGVNINSSNKNNNKSNLNNNNNKKRNQRKNQNQESMIQVKALHDDSQSDPLMTPASRSGKLVTTTTSDRNNVLTGGGNVNVRHKHKKFLLGAEESEDANKTTNSVRHQPTHHRRRKLLNKANDRSYTISSSTNYSEFVEDKFRSGNFSHNEYYDSHLFKTGELPNGIWVSLCDANSRLSHHHHQF